MMPQRPLPDFTTFRQRWLRICLSLLALLWLAVALVSDGMVVFWAIYGTFFAALIYAMHAAALSGDGTPFQPLSRMTVLGLSFGLAFFDAMLVYAWTVILDMVAMVTGLFPVFWVDYVPYVAIGGFVVGVVVNSLSGLYLPRFAYLRLLLWGHLFGCVLLVVPGLWGWLSGWGLRDDLRSGVQELNAFGVISCTLLVIWGIAPAAYLYAYRGYEKRLAITDAGLADETEMD